MYAVKKKKSKSKGRVLSIPVATVVVTTGFNNTHICFVKDGEVKLSISAGHHFKGPKKSMPYASQFIASTIAEAAKEKYNTVRVNMITDGPGNARDPVLKAFAASGLVIMKIKDRTAVPFNGCRPKKRRRP